MAKPASSAVINPGNALFNSMSACWPMLEGSGTTTADKKGTRTLTLASGGGAPTWSTNGAGEAIIALGTALSAPLVPASSLNLPGTRNWAIAWRAKETTSGTNSMLLGDRSNTTDFLWMAGGSYLGIRSSSSTDSNFTDTSVKDNFTTDANYLAVFHQDAISSSIRLFKNGSEVTGSPVSAGNTTALNINTVGNAYTSNTFAFIGALTYIYVWDSYDDSNVAADAAALHADPYHGLTTSPTIFMTPTRGEASRQVNLTVNGFLTTWNSATPPVFSLSGGTGASIVSTNIVNDTTAIVAIQPGSALGTLTLTENASGATATFNVTTFFVGGMLSAAFANDASVNGDDATGRTFLDVEITRRIRQHGPITQVRALVTAISGTLGWQFKVFRPNGSNFDVVSSSELITPAGTGTQTFTLSTPMACQPGDILGLWIKEPGNSIGCKAGGPSPSIKFDPGNQTGTNWNPGNSVNSFFLCLNYRCAFVTSLDSGDSRSAGHNGATYWYTHYETGPAGLLTAQPIHVLQGIIDPTRTAWTYQNFAKGSQTWAFLASDEFPDAFQTYGLAPQFVFTQCGVNDVNAPRTNSAILADMDSCYALVPANTMWYIDEVLAWTAGNDTQAAALRSLNAAYHTWAVGKPNVKIVSCHDAMAQLRVSTGQLDDMLSSYDYDSVHMTNSAGVTKLAELRFGAMNTIAVFIHQLRQQGIL